MPRRLLPAICAFWLACALAPCLPHHCLAGASPQAATAGDQDFDMHAPYIRYHFADPDMDFTFGSVVLGSISNQGCETGEAFYVAANIKDGDAASWQEQWIKMAERVEARGLTSLAEGHAVSAREQLLRASNYYRFGLMAMLPDDPRLRSTAAKSREAMKEAGKLFDPPLEYVEISFEGTVLPGYFRKAANDATPRKTLLMLGGGGSVADADRARGRGPGRRFQHDFPGAACGRRGACCFPGPAPAWDRPPGTRAADGLRLRGRPRPWSSASPAFS